MYVYIYIYICIYVYTYICINHIVQRTACRVEDHGRAAADGVVDHVKLPGHV